MKIAYVYHLDEEKRIVTALLRNEKPEWTLVEIEENALDTLASAINLIKSGFDAIVIHLSVPKCLALKMAELCRTENHSTKIIILSGTRTNAQLMNELFDGFVRKPYELPRIVDIINDCLQQPAKTLSYKEVKKNILKIIEQDAVLQEQIKRALGIRYKYDYSFDDYNLTVERDIAFDNSMRPGTFGYDDIFISYSEKDERLAEEFLNLFSEKNIACFMAKKSISSGFDWETAIKERLKHSKEVVLLLTPNSIQSQWVLLEAGAAWVMDKPLTPCVFFADINQLPSVITKKQAKNIQTNADKLQIVNEIAARISSKRWIS
ncbi:MAG: toll/interleukin-1 receptor domain-containing protein [Candidatus Omnitrophota bacterium]